MTIWRVDLPSGQNDDEGLYGDAARQTLPSSQVTSATGLLPPSALPQGDGSSLLLVSPEKLSYSSSDGVEIHAYLYEVRY